MDSSLSKKVISTKEAAEVSGYTPDHLARLARSGEIEGTQVGRTWLINRESFSSFLKIQGRKEKELVGLISSKEASKEYGYTSDYLARLARLGEIEAVQVGRNWLINRDSLARFKELQTVRKEESAQELAHSRAQAYRKTNLPKGEIKEIERKIQLPQIPEEISYTFTSLLKGKFVAVVLALLVVGSGALASEYVLPVQKNSAAFLHTVAEGAKLAFGDLPTRVVSRVRVTDEAIHSENIFASLVPRAFEAPAPLLQKSSQLLTTSEETSGTTKKILKIAVLVSKEIFSLAKLPVHATYAFADVTRNVFEPLYGLLTRANPLRLALIDKGEFTFQALKDTPLLAAAVPALSFTERTAVTTYFSLKNLFDSTTNSIASLFTSPEIVLPTRIPKERTVTVATSTPSTPKTTTIVTSNPTYTTVVKGVSEETLNFSLSALRTEFLTFATSLVQPVSTQQIQNIQTIQNITRVEDLTGLIVRNGDFRGGTFSNGTLSNGLSVSADEGTFDNLTGGTTSFSNTTVTGDLAVSGTIFATSSVSSLSSVFAPYFVATSTTATSTFAGSLALDTDGFVYATSTRNVGIGVLSPAALLAVQNSTSTQPIFTASDDTGAEVYRITNAGFVGIGSTTPTYALSVEGTSSLGNQAIAGYFTATSTTATSTFAGGFTVNNTDFVVDQFLNRVGIGTSTPNQKLSLFNASADSAIEFSSFSGADYKWTIGQDYSDAGKFKISSSSALGTADRFVIDGSGNVGIGTTSPTYTFSVEGISSLGNEALAGYFTATSSSATSTFAGGATFGGSGLVYQQATGKVGIGTTSPSQNFSVAGNTYITGGLGIGVATTTSGVLQTSGDTWVGGNLTVVGNSTVFGDSTTLGESSSDTLVVNSSIGSNLVPTVNATYDLGSPSFFWDDGFFDTITANNISAASTSISGTQSQTFTLNSDNATSDTENIDLIFFRGTVVPNALITWDSTLDTFDINQPLFIQNDSSSTNIVTLDVKGTSGQTADLFRVRSFGSVDYLNLSASGNLGIGSSTPLYKLSVEGTSSLGNQAIAGYFTATSSTASTFAGAISVDDTTDSTSVTTGSIHTDGGLGVAKDVYIGSNLNVASNSIIGSTSVTPDGTLHVYSGDAGSVAVNTTADDFIVENSSDAGISVLSPDASFARIALGSPTDSVGSYWDWKYSTLQGRLLTGTVGASLILAGDNGITNLTLSGASGSEAANVSGSLVVGSASLAADGGVGTVHIQTGSAGSVAAASTARNLVVENSTTGGITVLTPDASLGRLYFGTPSDNAGALVTWDYANSVFAVGPGKVGASLRLYGDDSVTNLTLSGASGSELATFAKTVGVATSSPWGLLSVNPNGISGPSFVVGSSTKTDFIVNNAGEVGIGTADPLGYKLNVENTTSNGLRIKAGAGSTGSYEIRSLDSDGNVDFVVRGDGNVGIGSSTPLYKLSVEGTSSLGNQAIAGYFTATSSTASTFAGAISVDDTTDSTSVTTGSIHTDGGLGVVKSAYVGANIVLTGSVFANDDTSNTTIYGGSTSNSSAINIYGPSHATLANDIRLANSSATVGYWDDSASTWSLAGKQIIGSTSVTPDGTLHVHTATAGSVTAASTADDLVVENSGGGGISILVPDANNSSIFFGSPSDSNFAFLQANQAAGTFYVSSSAVGASLILQGGNAITNLTLSGASGSELATFAGDVNIGGDINISGTFTSSGGLTNYGVVTAPYFVATSTTATSTFAGGLTVDSTDLVVDPDGGRVGIGTASPEGKLDVNGNTVVGSVTTPGVALSQLTFRNLGTNFLHFYDPGLTGGSGGIAVGGSTAYGTAPSAPIMFWGATSGNVGIGSTTPLYKLSVEGTSSLGNQAIAGYFTATSSTASTFAGAISVDDTTDSTSVTTGSIHTDGGLGVAKDVYIGSNLNVASNSIIGSTSVTPDGTLHVHTATAGSVTAATTGDDLVVENSATGGITILVPDASDSAFYFGSPSDNSGALLAWGYDTNTFRIGTAKVGASTVLRADDSIINLTLSGAGGSELATFAGDATLSEGKLTITDTANETALGLTSSATTANALSVTASSLTTGSAGYFYSNSADTSSRNLVNIINDNSASSGTTALRVQQDSTGDIVNFFDGGTEVFTILDGGNVGVGTTGPGEHLSIEGTGTQDLSVYSTDTGVVNTQKTFIRLYGKNTAGTKIEQVRLSSAPGSSQSTAGQFIVSTNNSSNSISERMRINEDGNVGIGSTTPWGLLSVNPSGISGPSFVVGSSTATNFIVTNAGKVGIGGTTNPTGKLHVTDTTASDTNFIMTVRGSDSGRQLQFVNYLVGGDADRVGLYWENQGVANTRMWMGDNGYLYDLDSTPTSANGGRRYIRESTAGGNVGIGSSTPLYKLSVEGTSSLGNQAIAGYFTATSSTASTFAGAISVDDTTDSSSTVTGSIHTDGGLGVAKALYVGTTGHIAGNTIIGSTSVTPDGTLHVYNGTAGVVTANTAADELVVEVAGSGGISILTTDGGYGDLTFGSASSNKNASLTYSYSENIFRVGTFKTGGILRLRGGNGVENLDLSGASGSELATFAGDATLSEGKLTITDTANETALGLTSSATTANALSVTASSLTTGSAGYFYSNSADTSSRNLVNIINDNSASSGTTALRVQQDSTGDIVNFFDGGTEVFTILDGGNVGIGSSTPYAKLSVTNTGSGPSFLVEDSTSPDSTPFIIDTSGNVGIGTATPDGEFVVEGAKAGTIKAIISNTRTTSDANAQLLIRTGHQNAGDPFLTFSNLNTKHYSLGIDSDTDVFKISGDNVLGSSDYLTIDGSGNVGIGTTTPGGKLHVVTADAGNVSAAVSFDDFIVENNGNAGISVLTPDANLGSLAFGTPSDNGGALVQWDYTNSKFVVGSQKTGGSTVILSGDNVTNLTLSGASGSELATFAGTVNVTDGLSVTAGNLDVSGSATASHFIADSTTATSTFAGGLTVDSTDLVVDPDGGRVGIGTASPEGKLQVGTLTSGGQGSINGASSPTRLIVNSSAEAALTLGYYSAGYGLDLWVGTSGLAPIYFDQRNNDSIIFRSNTYTTPVETMRITSSGKIGIGSTTPLYKLSVEGTSSLGNQAIAGYFTATSSTASTFAGAISVDDTTDSSSTVTGSIHTDGGLGVAKALYVGTTGHIAGNTIIGSTSVTPDGTLHVHTATAGSVTANTAVDDFVVEGSGDSGLSILVPDANLARIAFGSPSDNFGAALTWQYSTSAFNIGPSKVGASLTLQGGDAVTNLTLSGASGSELATFAGNVTLSEGELSITSTNTSANAFAVSGAGNDGVFAARVTQTGTGYGLGVYRAVSAATRPLALVAQTHASGGTQAALLIQQADSGETALAVNEDGSLTNFNFKVLSTGGTTITDTANETALGLTSSATTANALSVTASSLTTGSAGYFYSNSADTSTRNLVNIINDNSASSGTTALRVQQDSAGDIVNFFDGSTEVLTVLDGGNVGISSTNPASKLQINSNTQYTTLGKLSDAALAISLGSTSTVGNLNQILLGYHNVYAPVAISAVQMTASAYAYADLVFATRSTATDVAPTERMRITSTGNVGIGSTTPWGLLSVNPSGISGPSFVVGSSTATNFIVTNGGYVGIGTTNPTSKLLINYNDAAAYDSSGATPAPASGRISLFNEDTTVGATAGAIQFGSGLSGTARATITGVREAADAGALAFGTAPASGNDGVERVRITSSGNVGIGTTTPGGKLHVYSGAAGAVTAGTSADDLVIENSGNVGITLLSPAANTSNIYFGTQTGGSSGAQIIHDYSNSQLVMRTNRAGASLVLGAGAAVTNLTLSGASGSELATFAGTVNVTDALAVTAGTFTTDGGNVVLNEAGADYDFRVEADNNTAALNIDGGLNSGIGNVGIGGAALTNIQLAVRPPATTATAATSFGRVHIEDQGAITTYSSGTHGAISALYLNEPNITIGTAGVTVASTLYIADAPTEGSTNSALYVASGDSIFASGDLTLSEGKLAITDTANETALGVTSSAATANALSVTASSLTTGSAGYFYSDSSTTDTRNLVNIINDNTLATGATVLRLQQDSTGDIVNFFDGGTEVFTILDGGNVGIGSTTPYATLSVTNIGSGPSFLVEDATSPDSSPFIIDASGNVGIGTTALSSYKFGVIGNSAIAGNLDLHGCGGVTCGNKGSFSFNDTTGSLTYSSAGGTLKQVIFSNSGGVSVASTTPWGLLSVNPSGISGPSFVVGSSTATQFIVTNAGKVGIGTASPDTTFQIVSTGSADAVDIQGTGTGGAYLQLTETGSKAWSIGIDDGSSVLKFREDSYAGEVSLALAAVTTAVNYFQISGSATGVSPTLSAQGDDTNIGIVLTPKGSGGVGIASTTPWGLLSVNPDGISGPSFVIGSSTATQFIVTNAGKVGIGTASPDTRTVISGDFDGSSASPGNDDNKGLKIAKYSGSSSDWSLNDLYGITFSSASNESTDYGVAGIMAEVTGVGSHLSGSLHFFTNNNASTMTSAMTINALGNVGIGTTTPGSKLQVEGNIAIKNNSGLQFFDTTNTARTLFTYDSSLQVIIGNSSNVINTGIRFDPGGVSGTASSMTLSTAGVLTPGADNANNLGSSSLHWSCLYYDATNLGTCSSDSLLKSNIQDFSFGEDALAQLTNLRPRTFEWKDNLGTTNYGLIAQEVQTAAPDLVTTDENGYLAVHYGYLPYLTIEALKELNSKTAGFFSATTTESVTIDSLGNIGIGTTSPQYKLHVVGDVAATSFVNTSTKTAKKNIVYDNASSTESRFEQIKNLKVATYRYNIEDDEAPLRLGLIAEDAQESAPEILSADGKGVDIYKLATLTLSGVQVLAEKFGEMDARLTSLETRLTALESGAISSGGGTFSFSTTTLIDALGSFEGIVRIKNLAANVLYSARGLFDTLVAGNATIGSTLAPAGVTLFDTVTKEPYCLTITNGVATTTPGECTFIDANLDPFASTTISIIDPEVPSGSGENDITPPDITLVGANPVNLSIGGTYFEPGVVATDAVDGAIFYLTFVDGVEQTTDTAVIDTSLDRTYLITYSATDESGNTATVERSVIVGLGSASTTPTTATTTTETATTTPITIEEADATAPVIILSGNASMELITGDIFVDAGATATDDTDGDLTASISVSGSVDTATPGIYTLTYSATDTAGNTSSASRTVTVIELTLPEPPSETATSTATSTPAT